MGRGSSGAKGDASSVLGRSNKVPSEDDIKAGGATYGGLPVKYDARATNDASNWTTEIHVSPKFFEHNENQQRAILNHEVAHNWSDEMMDEGTRNWRKMVNTFTEEKKVPKGSAAWERGQRTYIEGLYGDIGATAVSETTTRAITEYLDDPNRLKQRSEAAYNYVRRFVNKKLRQRK